MVSRAAQDQSCGLDPAKAVRHLCAACSRTAPGGLGRESANCQAEIGNPVWLCIWVYKVIRLACHDARHQQLAQTELFSQNASLYGGGMMADDQPA